MKRTAISRGTKQMRRTPFRSRRRVSWVKKLPKGLRKPKIKRRGASGTETVKGLSPILKINLGAKSPTWEGFKATRYRGVKGVAWTVCSKYIRKRDGGQCSTCPHNQRDGYQMQAGHYQPIGLVGSNNKLSWDEMNIHCQCSDCNGRGEGEQERMGEYIRRKYGCDVVDGLVQRRNRIDPVENWEEMIMYYHNKLKAL